MYYLLTKVLCNSLCIWKHLKVNDSPEIFNQAWISQDSYRHNRFPSSTECHCMQFSPPVLRWRNVTVQLLLLIMKVFTLLIKIINFLIPVSPTTNRQVNSKTGIHNTKFIFQLFCTEVIARFWLDTACILLDKWIHTLSFKEQSQKGMTVFACLQCLLIFVRSEQCCHNGEEDPVNSSSVRVLYEETCTRSSKTMI